MEQFVLLILFCLSFQLCWCQEEVLTCVEAKAKFPIPLIDHGSFYDGENSIYIFGGHSLVSDVNTIYKYDINEDTITLVATFPEKLYVAIVTFDKENVYVMGGYNNNRQFSDKIYKFELESHTVTLVGNLDSAIGDGVGMKYNESSDSVQILAFGSRGLKCLNLSNLTSCGQTTLITQNRFSVKALVVNGFAYIFAQISTSSQIEKIDLSTLESELVPGEFPMLYYPTSVVFDGRYGYIIGGHREEDDGIPTNGIIRYDPETFEHQFIPVANFPASGRRSYGSGSAEYVKKLNRIYMFGGFTGGAVIDTYRNEIWYIDLNLATNTTTTTEGMYGKTQKLVKI